MKLVRPRIATPSKVFVADSPIHGKGVFAALDIKGEEQILTIDDSREVTEANPLRAGESKDHCDWLAGGKVVLMQPPERFINHSCDPNSFVKTVGGVRHVFALRDIPARAEIACDYALNGYGDAVWQCACESGHCRKRVHGDFFRLPYGLQMRYLPLLDRWFVEENQARIEKLIHENERKGT